MRKLEEFARRVTENLDVSLKRRECIAQELFSHLMDERESCLEEGMGLEDATRVAMERFGSEE